MDKLQIFKSSEFGEVRTTIGADGEPRFCLADVCKALGIHNTSSAKKRLNPKGAFLIKTPTIGGEQEITFIDETNLYRAIFQCRKKQLAQRFQDWVFEEVLPSIRKTGGYMIDREDETEEELMARALAVAQATLARREKRLRELEAQSEEQQAEIVVLSDKIAEMKPKTDYCDIILSSKDSVVVTQIAQDYGMSAQELNKRLASLGVQRKVHGQWILRAEHIGEGYVDSQTYLVQRRYGPKSVVNTQWTQKGRMFMYNILKNHGVLPVMERSRGYTLPPIKQDEEDSIYK